MRKQIELLFITLLALSVASSAKGQEGEYGKDAKLEANTTSSTTKPALSVSKRSRSVLEFVCKNDKAWSMENIPLYAAIDSAGKTKYIASVTDSQQKQLKSIFHSNETWPQKMAEMAALTPVHVQIVCKYDEQVPIKDVVAKFGQPDKKEAATIYTGQYGSKTNGLWYFYGSVRLGVWREGFILTVRIDGPVWQKEITEAAPSDVRLQAPNSAELQSADAQVASINAINDSDVELLISLSSKKGNAKTKHTIGPGEEKTFSLAKGEYILLCFYYGDPNSFSHSAEPVFVKGDEKWIFTLGELGWRRRVEPRSGR